MSIKSFKRYEKKFIIDKEQYSELIPRLLEYMKPDKYCKNGKNYTIYNVYYDTLNNDVISHSISKPYYKEKLRLRSYSVPTSDNDTVFLELKKKINGIVNKRRLVLTFKEATDFLNYGCRPKTNNYIDTQVLNEIEYYLSKNKVYPAVYIGYTRKAFFARDDHNFRLTFDSKILTRRTEVDLEYGYYGDDLLQENQFLMEVKILGAIPLWFTKLLSEFNIYNTQFSKYGNEYMNYCINNKNDKNKYTTRSVKIC